MELGGDLLEWGYVQIASTSHLQNRYLIFVFNVVVMDICKK
ncbi:hypothetical protein Golob_023752, partial [Gossypium lobatum]|nr:hypothetical protein [Gossypium lobatum]